MPYRATCARMGRHVGHVARQSEVARGATSAAARTLCIGELATRLTALQTARTHRRITGCRLISATPPPFSASYVRPWCRPRSSDRPFQCVLALRQDATAFPNPRRNDNSNTCI
eukprot:3670917-Prymnesium_polylepis.1